MTDARSDAYRAEEEEEKRVTFQKKQKQVDQMQGLFAQLTKVRAEKAKLLVKERALLEKIHKHL